MLKVLVTEKTNEKEEDFQMKKITVLILCFVLVLSALAIPVAGRGDTSKQYNWFVGKHEKGQRPELATDADFLKDYPYVALGSDEKVVYLTFDAGYGNENVEKILDTLKKHEVQGLFFILPGIVKYSPETVKRMVNDGHVVGNHSYSHGNMAKIRDVGEFKSELVKLESCYKELTGQEMSKFFRPPEGAYSENTLIFCEELGYTPVFWSFAYADWDNNKQMNPEKAEEKILSCVHNGMVMLLHPTSATNAAVLDSVITKLKADGYRFGRIDELAK